jgi:hypothetical protein
MSTAMTRFGVRLAIALLLVAAAIKPALADEPDAVVASPPGTLVPAPNRPFVPLKARPERVEHGVALGDWYGWQALAADAAAIGGVWLTGSAAPVGLYLIPPIIHGVHRGPGRAAGSLALRVGLPFLGMIISSATARCEDRPNYIDFCDLDAMGRGILIGGVAAMLIDDLWAFDEVAPSPPLERAPPAMPSSSLTPTVSLSGSAAGVGLSGRF